VLPRFYPILDLDTLAGRGLPLRETAQSILSQPIRILQFRHKGFFSAQVFEDLKEVDRMCRAAGVMLVLNDRAEIARLAGTALHLGQEDLTPSEARRIVGAEALIGYSTHNEAQLRSAAKEPADYLAIGPIFGTASKANHDPVVGVDELRRLRPMTGRPLVAIGGITRSNALSVLEGGADSVAVIGDLFPENGRIADRIREWLDLLG
jgi:thiamine-phosphate pyrophosphorylase